MAGVLALAALAAYADSLSGAFVFDDFPAIVDNPSLRHLWPLGRVLTPPHGGVTVEGRPILNLSFAINWALGGSEVAGYHAANLLIHVLAGLALFGVVRRTLGQPRWRERFGADALGLAFVTAAWWMLHPLQTEAVTYVVQRAESLMGLLYLLTLYCFIRGAEREKPFPGWWAAACGACLLGMGTKEVMVSAPVMVLLYDRTFLAGSFHEAWRRRRGIHLALAATWIPLGLLVAGTGGNRGGTSGPGAGAGFWAYGLTQFHAVARYLGLSVWPHPLVFEYGPSWVSRASEVAPDALVVLPLAAGTLYALWKRPVLGFLGFWFFGILAPTSLVPGPLQMIVEHRMYLPLAAILALVAASAYRLGGRRALAGLMVGVVGFGFLTARRNLAYRSELSLWEDTATKRPLNPAAHSGLGMALAAAGRRPEAIGEFEEVLRLLPDDVAAHVALGNLLSEAGRPAEGLEHLATALRLRPDDPEAHQNRGAVLDRMGQTEAAVREYELALRLKPRFPEAHNDLSDALRRLGRTPAAIQEAETALALRPAYAEARYNLANALAQVGRLPEAEACFAEGAALKPNDAAALHAWGNVLAGAGHVPESLAAYQAAIGVDPGDSTLRYDFANALAAAARFGEAARQYEEAVRLRPGYAEAEDNLGNALVLLQRDAEAVAHYRRSLRLNPGNPRAHNNLGLALARLGQLPAAAVEFAAAVGLDPGYGEARANLARAQAELRPTAP